MSADASRRGDLIGAVRAGHGLASGDLSPTADPDSNDERTHTASTRGIADTKRITRMQVLVCASTSDNPSQDGYAHASAASGPGGGPGESGLGARTTDWVVRRMGYTRQSILERDARPWLMMIAVFPLPWLATVCLLLLFCLGSQWHGLYVGMMVVIAFDYVFMRPFTLETTWAGSNMPKLARVFSLLRMVCLVVGSVTPLPGLVDPGFVYLVPFRSPTAYMATMLLLGPLIVFIAHFHSPWLRLTKSTTTAVPTLAGMAIFNFWRYTDPIADCSLGLRILLNTADSVEKCPFRGGANCTAHHVIGMLIVILSGFDFTANACIMAGVTAVFLPGCTSRSQVTIFEAFMLGCEVSTLVCVLTLSLTGMISYNTETASYTVFCTMSTVGAMSATMVTLLTPETAVTMAAEGKYKSALIETVHVYGSMLRRKHLPAGVVAPEPTRASGVAQDSTVDTSSARLMRSELGRI